VALLAELQDLQCSLTIEMIAAKTQTLKAEVCISITRLILGHAVRLFRWTLLFQKQLSFFKNQSLFLKLCLHPVSAASAQTKAVQSRLSALHLAEANDRLCFRTLSHQKLFS
jgi:hypothetical protein